MISDGHTQWLLVVTRNDYGRSHTMITDGRTQWLPAVTHNDYGWSRTMITDGHTQWLPAVTHNDNGWSRTMITGDRTQRLLAVTQWLPAIAHKDYWRSHTMITNGHTQWLQTVTHNDYRNVGKNQNGTSYTRVSAHHNLDARAPLWSWASQRLERIPSEKCSKSNLQTYLSANSGTWEQVFRWRSSPFPFPKFMFTLLKIPYPNRNHRRKLYSTKSAQSTVVPSSCQLECDQ